ncbi:32706_t:CDS:2, partial [Racocetra persica]
MADVQETKLKYRRGTCFSNRTAAVKNAFTRLFNPNWVKEQVDYVRQKIAFYNYSLSTRESFSFSLCSRCNSSLLRLSSKAKKLKTLNSNPSNSIIANNNFQEIETYDLTTSMSEPSEFEEMYELESNKQNYYKKEY